MRRSPLIILCFVFTSLICEGQTKHADTVVIKKTAKSGSNKKKGTHAKTVIYQQTGAGGTNIGVQNVNMQPPPTPEQIDLDNCLAENQLTTKRLIDRCYNYDTTACEIVIKCLYKLIHEGSPQQQVYNEGRYGNMYQGINNHNEMLRRYWSDVRDYGPNSMQATEQKMRMDRMRRQTNASSGN